MKDYQMYPAQIPGGTIPDQTNCDQGLAANTAGQALLTRSMFRGLLGDVSERKFDEMLASGLINQPLELGPRAPRWTRDDYQQTVARLARRAPGGEPSQLAKARRERIDAMKSCGSAVHGVGKP